MRILDQGILYDATSAPLNRRFCAFTNTTILSDGRILVAFHAGSAKESPDENVLMRLSADGGHTWEVICDGLEPLAIDGKLGSWHHGRLTELAPGHLLGAFWWLDRSDPSLPMIHPETTGTLPNRILLMDSFDDGRTWTNRREVDTRPFPSVALMGAPLVLAQGGIAVVSEAWKTYYDAGFGEHSAILSISHDDGQTFEPSVVVAHDPANRLLFWDQRLTVDPVSGRLIGMFWTHDRQAGQDRNTHIAWSDTSSGRSWSNPVDAGFAGQIPRPLVLPDGRVLCVYVHRHWPPALRALLSSDCGLTWDVANELVFYEHAAGTQAGMDGKRDFADYYADMRVWSFGHAEPGLLPNGNVFVAFYAGDTGSLGVRWARIEILSEGRGNLCRRIIMDSRERVLAAAERRRPDRPPIDLTCTPEAMARLRAHLGVATNNAVLDTLDVDMRRIGVPFIGPAERSAAPLGSEGVDFWGCRTRKVETEFNTYYEWDGHPLADCKTVADVEAHDWPSLDWWDYAAMPRLIEEQNAAGRRAIMFFAGGAFETPWYLRGLEQFLVDLRQQPEIAEAISRRVEEFYRLRALRVLDVARDQIDIIGSGGDIGTQRGMMLNPATWRRHIKPYSGRLINTFKALGLKTFYHSCGSIVPVIPDLIAVGLDLLDPIQPRAAGMAAEALFEAFGDRLSFHGGIDEQELLPHGTPDQVYRETTRIIDILGQNGGYVVASAHDVQGDTPPENVVAMCQAARDYRWH